jgi:hypothetical protein
MKAATVSAPDVAVLSAHLGLNRWALTVLDLGGSRIGDVGARVMACALRTNTTLQSLDLSSNAIGAVGAGALCTELRANNATLTALDLHDNELDGADNAAMREALHGHASLTKLILITPMYGLDLNRF